MRNVGKRNWFTTYKCTESDALNAVSSITSFPSILFSYGNLVNDIQCLYSYYPRVLVVQLHREVDITTHGLAKFALRINDELVRSEDNSQPIEYVVVLIKLQNVLISKKKKV